MRSICYVAVASIDTEPTEHFHVTIGNINYRLLKNTDSFFLQMLFFGSNSFNITGNAKIFNPIINFILFTKIFDEPFFKTKSI